MNCIELPHEKLRYAEYLHYCLSYLNRTCHTPASLDCIRLWNMSVYLRDGRPCHEVHIEKCNRGMMKSVPVDPLDWDDWDERPGLVLDLFMTFFFGRKLCVVIPRPQTSSIFLDFWMIFLIYCDVGAGLWFGGSHIALKMGCLQNDQSAVHRSPNEWQQRRVVVGTCGVDIPWEVRLSDWSLNGSQCNEYVYIYN